MSEETNAPEFKHFWYTLYIQYGVLNILKLEGINHPSTDMVTKFRKSSCTEDARLVLEGVFLLKK